MHQPVLLTEVIKFLQPRSEDNFIDCTIGLGGHSLAILNKTQPNGKVLGVDADPETIKKINSKIKSDELKKRLILVQGNFKNLKEIVAKKDFKPVNGILFDLGLSSWQIEESNRGFSFKKDQPLDMRFSFQDIDARQVVNKFNFQKLSNIFREYGEERFSKRIARKIIEERKIKPITTTLELRRVVETAVPKIEIGRGRIDRVLARIFQALRIEVNQELSNLKKGLEDALDILESKGRLIVISFHSLEDRIVKNFYKQEKQKGTVEILTKKPVTAGEEEIKNNPSSRSAKLRALIKQ